MYLPSTIPYQQHRGFSRTFTPGHLSLGLFFPLEAFGGDIPSMLNQVALAKRAEELGTHIVAQFGVKARPGAN